ncbi:hypothetical protein KO465_04930 [Candidatus Micrarchaeota archaeon]|nr:hypothetical protein [Candidatus Micrarchaeota archaeon]
MIAYGIKDDTYKCPEGGKYDRYVIGELLNDINGAIYVTKGSLPNDVVLAIVLPKGAEATELLKEHMKEEVIFYEDVNDEDWYEEEEENV